MSAAADHLDRVLALRVLYRRRGPLDGRAGITPDGRVAPQIRWSLPSVMEDANATIQLTKVDHARWRAAMGMDDEPAEITAVKVMSWADQCPDRGPGLSHARLAKDPSGVCVHCETQIR